MEEPRETDGDGGVQRSSACADAVTRRDLIVGSAAVGGALLLPFNLGDAPAQTLSTSEGGVAMRLLVNGMTHELALDPRSSLLDVLREQLALTGAKKGCDHGQCGACTVHIDGRRVVSCLTPAVQAAEREATTIEGIAPSDSELHPMQRAFGGILDGSDDADIGGAAAEIAAHVLADLVGRPRMPLVHAGNGGHDLARRAVAALQRVVVDAKMRRA
jgi:ferredoxin